MNLFQIILSQNRGWETPGTVFPILSSMNPWTPLQFHSLLSRLKKYWSYLSPLSLNFYFITVLSLLTISSTFTTLIPIYMQITLQFIILSLHSSSSSKHAYWSSNLFSTIQCLKVCLDSHPKPKPNPWSFPQSNQDVFKYYFIVSCRTLQFLHIESKTEIVHVFLITCLMLVFPIIV